MALGLDYACRLHGPTDHYVNTHGDRLCILCRKERNRRYYERKRQQVLVQQAEYRKSRDKEVWRLKKREEFRRRLGPRVDYRKCWERDSGICYLCGEPVDLTESHADHIMPLSKGGTHSEDNIGIVHPKCNLRKGSQWPLA